MTQTKWWLTWLVLINLIVVSRWAFPERWQRYLVRPGQLVTETIDCTSQADSPEALVSLDNAERIFTEGFTQSLVAKEDGCYRLHQRVQLSSIRRTAKTRTIYRQHEWGPVFVSMIIKVNFEALDPRRKQFALGKFADARELDYYLVTFAADANSRPVAPPLVEQTHPAAKLLKPGEHLKVLAPGKTSVISLSEKARVPMAVNTVFVPEHLVPATVADPEEDFRPREITKLIAGLKVNDPVIVMGNSDLNSKAYNLVTVLQLRGYKDIFWMPHGLKSSDLLPDSLPGLETVDCWKAIELLRAGAISSTLIRPKGFAFVWYGRNRMDLDYLKSIQSQISPSLLKSRRNPKERDYWFPGGAQEMEWCLKHDIAGTLGLEDDI